MLTFGWMMESRASISTTWTISSLELELASIRLTWTVKSIKTRAYVQISTRISPREGPAC
ncbi:unnamed protein product [Brassica napus]|uniref:(rape) hypothetical protein n=1 Tax=Brassica napus TaxID=3708 RepID=A0A816SR09_BRANA|nr:unnamed protein product [Brassica napus]